MKMVTGFVAVLLALVSVAPTYSFGGNTPQFCNAYADKAVAQFNQARKHNLPGIVPPVWSNDRNGHYNWCLITPEKIVNEGSAKRQEYLDKYLTNNPAASGMLTGVVGTVGKMADMGSIIAAARANSYLGCFKDQQSRDLSGFSFQSADMTTDSCLAQCGQKGASYAGLQYGTFCFCGNDYGSLGKSAECNMPCAGNKHEICGGKWANSVYRVKASATVAGAIPQVNKQEFCKKYAQNAVRQFALAQEHSLPNITPPVWSADTKGHYEWCMRTSKEAVIKGGAARQNYLDKNMAKDTQGGGMTTGTITGTAIIPDYEKIVAGAVQRNPAMQPARGSLRWAIANTDGGKFEVTPGTSFSIPKGALETKQLINVPEIGLYKVHIVLSYNNAVGSHISLSPRIDQEGYIYQLLPESHIASGALQKIWHPAQAQKKTLGTFTPWIISDSSITTFSGQSANSDYYFWVDKKHLPASGRLQFRLQITKLENNGAAGSHGELGESGFVPPVRLDVKDHGELRGRFDVQYAAPFKAALGDTFLINGAKLPYSIIKLPSVQQSGMAFSVIETPVLSLKEIKKGSYKFPTLSFFLANAERLSSQKSPIPPPPGQGLFGKMQSPNRWIYRDVLQNEYGQTKDCDSIALDGAAVCAKYKGVRYYSWDAVPKGYNGSLLYDVINPPVGSYYAVVSNNPVDGTVYSLSHFSTTGLLLGAGLIAGDNLRNEVVVATRNSAPMKWTYVAELASVGVSEQAEYDSDDDDQYFGEFSMMATSILSETKGENQLTLRPDQIQSRSTAFPMVDNEDRPHNFAILPPNNSGSDFPKNAGGTIHPRMPIFVMDYDKLTKKYNSLLVNVVMDEHDKRTFWQRNGNVIKAFSNFIMNVGKVAFAGVDPGSVKGLAKSIYTFATTDLNPNVKVDDFMGNAALSVFRVDNYGLGNGNTNKFSITGPANSSYFDMQYTAQEGGRASISSSTDPKARSVSAVIKLRRVPQLHSRADIQLVSYTPVDDATWFCLQLPMGGPFKKQKAQNREQYLREGLLSNNHNSSTRFSFKNVKTGKVVKVRTAQEPSWSSLNKGVIEGDEWDHGRQTMHSQSWSGKGFTYYQAELYDLTPFGRFPAATISLTLYHDDVVKNAGKKGYTWLDTDGQNSGAMGIISTKLPGRNLYKVDIKLIDGGDWLKEANLVAYVYVE